MGFVKANPVPPPKWPNAEYTKCIQIENMGEIMPWYTSFFVTYDYLRINDKYDHFYQYVKTDDYSCVTPPLFFIDTSKKDIDQINIALQNDKRLDRKDFLWSEDIVLPIPHEYVWGYVGWRRKNVSNSANSIRESLRAMEMDIIYRIERDWKNLTARKIQERKYSSKDDGIVNYDDSPIIYSTDVKTYFLKQTTKSNV